MIAGLVQDILTSPEDETIDVVTVGLPGVPQATIDVTEENEPKPHLFLALTLKLYEFPAVKPIPIKYEVPV